MDAPAVVNQQNPFYGYVNPQSVLGMSPFAFANNPYVNAFNQQGFVAGPTWTPPRAKDRIDAAARAKAGLVASAGAAPLEQRPLSEKETKELKRKKANRESARRSKLRKKEEFESLAKKVDQLTSKGLALRTEIAKMEGVLETLSSQNETLKKEVVAVCGNLKCLDSLNQEEERSQEETGGGQGHPKAKEEAMVTSRQGPKEAMAKTLLHQGKHQPQAEDQETESQSTSTVTSQGSDGTNEVRLASQDR